MSLAGSFRNERLTDSGKSSKALFDGAKSVKGPSSLPRVAERSLVSRYLTSVVKFNTLATSSRFIAEETKRKVDVVVIDAAQGPDTTIMVGI